MSMMLEKLEAIEKRYEELNHLMSQQEVVSDVKRVRELAREQSGISGVVAKYREYKKASQSLEETRAMQGKELDAEMAALVKEEVDKLEARLEDLTQELRVALVPRDVYDEKDVIVEIRAGAGGDEAGLFAANLFRMYTRYAETNKWQVDVIDRHESGIGGFKEIVFEVKGKGVYSKLKYESGVHRVQRVPVTEASGRIHTSTATVAVLPEAEEVDVDIKPDDLRIDVFCAGGHGGQNVNKLATAVRITHLRTGITAVCQDERSQLRNKNKAMAVLRARVLDIERRKQSEEIARERRSQVGTGERSEKVRTYNFPQGRISDHRIGLTLYNIEDILNGKLDPIIDALAAEDQAKRLEGA
jgi:peptide chain release factor 1